MNRTLVMNTSRRCFLWGAGAIISGSLYTRFAGNQALAAAGPQYLAPFTDTRFGSKIVKVTNPNGPIPGLGLTWGDVAIHHYSIDAAWNSDQSLLVLDRGAKLRVFLDGRTYKPVMALSSPGEIRWHPKQADQMIWVSPKGIGLWDVRKNSLVIVSPLTGYSGAGWGNHKGNPSNDGRMMAVTAKRSDGKMVAFAIDLSTGRKYPDIDLSSEYRVGWTTISPSGAYIVSYTQTTSEPRNQRRRVFTRNGKLLQTWTEYERPGHGDFAIDNHGDEVFVGRSKSAPEKWQIIKRRLVDGKVTVLSAPCSASHVSARNLRNPGWVLATFTANDGRKGFAPYNNEVTFVAIDGSQNVRRLAGTHAAPNGYLTEPHGCPSPDGRKVIFASNWGAKNGPIAAYVAEFQ